MSVQRQEEALLALLFDRELRDAFFRDPHAALAAFDLTPEERDDFSTVRRAGLEVDAELRSGLVLSRLCRSLPLSFSIASAFDPALAARLLRPTFFAVPGVDRTRWYAEKMRAATLPLLPQPHGAELRAIVGAIFDLEIGMALLASSARKAAVERGSADAVQGTTPAAWDDQRLVLAPNAGVFRLPLPHAELLRELCPCPPDELWARLQHAALPTPRVLDLVARERPRLLVVRAIAERASRCEATVASRTVEMVDGFLPLLQEVVGGMTFRRLVEVLRQAGADRAFESGVRAGFQTMLDGGFLGTTAT